MTVIEPTKIRTGMKLVYDEQLWVVSSFQHVARGKVRSFVTAKLKNMRDGRVIEVTYKGSEQPVRANFEQRNGQFLYKEDADYHFMDMTTFEQFMLDDEMLGFSANFLVPEMEVVVAYWEEKPVGIEIPPKMEVTVTETIDEVERGNTANAVTKDATLENGMTIQVPPFIKTGEKIRISTDDGSYVERA